MLVNPEVASLLKKNKENSNCSSSEKKQNYSMHAIRESEEALKIHSKSSNNSGHMLIENLNKQENTLKAKLELRKNKYADRVKRSRKGQKGGFVKVSPEVGSCEFPRKAGEGGGVESTGKIHNVEKIEEKIGKNLASYFSYLDRTHKATMSAGASSSSSAKPMRSAWCGALSSRRCP